MDVHRQLGGAIDHRFPHHDGVHDRENAGPAVIVDLRTHRILEERVDQRGAFPEGTDIVGLDGCVELTAEEEALEWLVVRNLR
ncbi:hypothetical protein D3C83_178890 [compost metagenome]